MNLNDGAHIEPSPLSNTTGANGRLNLSIMGIEKTEGTPAWFKTMANGGLIQQHDAEVRNARFDLQHTRVGIGGDVELRVQVKKATKDETFPGSVFVQDDDTNDNVWSYGQQSPMVDGLAWIKGSPRQ